MHIMTTTVGKYDFYMLKEIAFWNYGDKCIL